MERIPAPDRALYAGHVARYRWASLHVRRGDEVADFGCGIGYGSTLVERWGSWRGYDLPGVPDHAMPGKFVECDLDGPDWCALPSDVAIAFEVLEHVRDPELVALRIAAGTRRTILVSVPTVPTTASNPFHRHDFTVDDVPPMFPGFRVERRLPQPRELSHVWRLERA